ncbi:hypothetical protein AVEN_129809-1 [Araneus ventricosus]|uniref:Uncharacterized protein n=1 Tax=Araneus ventricosus TaxID=182803 RepID=A0A4Y2NJR6_ARAVE|nr:hypothetical protein AVEN_129809-1 [Araneus ventricosus]
MVDGLTEAFASIFSASNCTEPLLTHKNSTERIKLRFQTTKHASCNTDLTIFELHTALSVIKHTSPGPDENADYCVPESFYHHYDSSHYRKMLMDIGFKVIHCMDEIKENILSNEEFRGN